MDWFRVRVVLANALIWAGVIAATGVVLRGTPHRGKLLTILGAGAGGAVIVTAAALRRRAAAQRGRGKPYGDSSMRVLFKFFESGTQSWQKMFSEVAEFATEVGPERLISISHSEDANNGTITVWYWDEAMASESAEQ